MDEKAMKRGTINLRALNGAFIYNFQGKTATKRCIVIPIEDNFVEERGYTNRAGLEIRTAELTYTMWPVTDEAREQYGKKHDWEMRLDIGKGVREALGQRDPATAAKLDRKNEAYDKELARQVFPYFGQAFDIHRESLAPEQVGTVSPTIEDGDDDLPF